MTIDVYADLSDGEILDIIYGKFNVENCDNPTEMLMQRIAEIDQITVCEDGNTKTFKNFAKFMEFANSFQMSPLPDEYDWWITKPEKNT
jgi:hypothetical protein